MHTIDLLFILNKNSKNSLMYINYLLCGLFSPHEHLGFKTEIQMPVCSYESIYAGGQSGDSMS